MQSIPVGGTGRNIEQVFDFQVDLPSTRVPRLPCYTARPPAADLLVSRQITTSHMQPKFNTVATVDGRSYDYSVFNTWLDALPISSEILSIGILGANAATEIRVKQFIERREYQLESSDFLLLTEAGVVLGSYIGRAWEPATEDFHSAFTGMAVSQDECQRLAFEYLRGKFGTLGGELDRHEVQTIFQTVTQRLAELVAKNPKILDQLEWRDVERLLAEVFAGIGFSVELTPSSKDGGKDIVLECVVSGERHTYVVEVKHWRSGQQVGATHIKDFIRVVVRESRNAGLFLSTYGFSSTAFEALAHIERQRLRLGTQEKIVSLCRTYVTSLAGIEIPAELLPSTFLDGTM